MILADTSVWIEHFRRRREDFGSLLEAGQIRCHPFVVGELSCGNLPNRAEVLGMLSRVPSLAVVSHDEATELLERRKLFVRGVGWIDVHLLASALVSGAALWTLDARLADAARLLRVAMDPA